MSDERPPGCQCHKPEVYGHEHVLMYPPTMEIEAKQ